MTSGASDAPSPEDPLAAKLRGFGPLGILAVVVVVIFGAGFGEETVFRGFLFERLGKLFGSGVGPKAAVILLTSACFGATQLEFQRRVRAPGRSL